jgi:hypothetical protein
MLPSAITQGVDFLKNSPKFDDATRRAVSYENAQRLFPRLPKT